MTTSEVLAGVVNAATHGTVATEQHPGAAPSPIRRKPLFGNESRRRTAIAGSSWQEDIMHAGHIFYLCFFGVAALWLFLTPEVAEIWDQGELPASCVVTNDAVPGLSVTGHGNEAVESYAPR